MAAVVDKRRDSLSQVAYDQIKTMILQKDLTNLISLSIPFMAN